jgi:conjugative transfer signal peptidase TraF
MKKKRKKTAVYGKQMLFFFDKELSRRAALPGPERSERTAAKRKTEEIFRAPFLGDSGDPDEPSEAELIELLALGNVVADDVVIQDEAGREYHIGKKRGLRLMKGLMKGKIKRIIILFIIYACAMSLLTIMTMKESRTYRINLSPSVPTGIWRVKEKKREESGDIKNEYVVVEASVHPGYLLAVERGYLHNLTPMLKRVVAWEGDLVSYDEKERAVTVNGEYIPMTEVLSRDTEGRVLPRVSFPLVLKKGEVWLSSENIRGYDSRYFGPVSTDLLRRATSVWIF